jgi:hypothetical protein
LLEQPLGSVRHRLDFRLQPVFLGRIGCQDMPLDQQRFRIRVELDLGGVVEPRHGVGRNQPGMVLDASEADDRGHAESGNSHDCGTDAEYDPPVCGPSLHANSPRPSAAELCLAHEMKAE